MRAEPPPPRRHSEPENSRARPRPHGRRCPYLEQILKEPAGPFRVLTRYKADCHVDHRTHRFTGRHPVPPCISEPESCRLYQSEQDSDSFRITRYTD